MRAKGFWTSVASAAAIALTPLTLAWGVEDDAPPKPLPAPPTVTIQGGPSGGDDLEGSTTEPSGVDDADQADKLDDFDHYSELLAASDDLETYLDDLEYGASNGTGALVLPSLGTPTSEYGPRTHPITGATGFHTGLDFGVGDGIIYAADAGVVVEAAHNTAYGNFVVIDHGLVGNQRLTTMYAHQPDLQVVVGQRVAKGQPIGTVGSTGLSTGPHLHFEVRLDGAIVNPAAMLPPVLAW